MYLVQSGTKPNLVAKILHTNFGVFFVIYVMFLKYVQCMSNDNAMEYCGWGIPTAEIWALENLEGYKPLKFVYFGRVGYFNW